MTPNPSPAKQEFTDPLQAINFQSSDDILKPETGLKIAKRIYSNQSIESDLNFFKARSERWAMLTKWATGRQDNKEFLPYLNINDANKSYLNIDMQSIMVGPQFVYTLVTSMAKNEEYPCVTAVDDASVSEKIQRKKEALFRMDEAETINKMEESLGEMLEPPNAYVPENPLAAEVYFKLEDRLPKEIEYEQKLEAKLLANQYQRSMKPKQYFDFIVNNFGATKLESDGKGGYYIRKCVPQNCVYNYFQSDTGMNELGYFGEVYSLKIRDIRSKYKHLSEKTLFRLAQDSTQNNVGQKFGWTWQAEFENYSSDRPWDEFSVPVLDFEILTEVSDYYVSNVDRYGKENIAPKKSKPEPKSEKRKGLQKKKRRWVRGIYAFHSSEMIFWGLPDLVLFKFQDTECGLSSYSVNIPLNTGEYTPSLFERALEPLKEYALTKLKRKQLIAKLRPAGIRIDIESARNIDLGNGQSIPWEEIVRIYDNTGVELYSSRGVNPNEREGPAISAGTPDDTVQKIMQLTQVLAELIVEIRNLLGVPMYRDGSDVGDRTAARLAEMQNTSSYNVTDYIPNALNQLMEETLYKCCILEWQKAVKRADKEDEIINTSFQVAVHMKPTEYQKKLLESRIELWSKTPDKWGNPLLSPKDVYYIENIKDFKLAQWYLANIIEENRKRAMEESAALDKQNAENQAAAAAQSNQSKMEIEDRIQQFTLAQKKAESENKQKETIVAGVFDILKAGMPITDSRLQEVIGLTLENLAIPLVQQNKQMTQDVQQQEMAEQQQAEQEQMIMQASQETGLPPEEIMAQMQNQQQMA
jgi:hypothetical protein